MMGIYNWLAGSAPGTPARPQQPGTGADASAFASSVSAQKKQPASPPVETLRGRPMTEWYALERAARQRRQQTLALHHSTAEPVTPANKMPAEEKDLSKGWELLPHLAGGLFADFEL